MDTKKTILSNAALIGASQSIALYPFEVASTRRWVNNNPSISMKSPLAGFSLSATQRFLKAGFTLSSYNLFMQQHNQTLPASMHAAISGAGTGLCEALVFNPFTVLKNHKQTNPNKPFLQILQELGINKLSAGTKATAQRNVTCSFISMGTFGIITHKDDPTAAQVLKGSAAFLAGGIAALPFERDRLNNVFSINHKANYLSLLRLLSPGLFKVMILGGLYGTGLHKINNGTNH